MSIITPGALNTDGIQTANLADNSVTDAKIDFGTGTNQVSTADIPEQTNLYYTDERVDDRVNALLVAGANVTLTYDDNANTLTIAATEDNLSNNTTDDLSEGSSNLYYTDARAINAVLTTAHNGNITLGSNANVQFESGTDANEYIYMKSKDNYLGIDANYLFIDADSSAMNISIGGTSAATRLDIAEDVKITGDLELTGNISADFDFFGNSNYPASGLKIVNSGTNRWTGIEMREYGSSGAPFNIFNPSLQALIGEGTSASPTAVGSGYRLFTFGATAHYDSTIPSLSNGQMQFVTTQAQTATARGTKLEIFTTVDSGGSSTAREKSLEIQDKRMILNPDSAFGGAGFELDAGSGVLKLKSDTLIEQDLEVTGNLEVDGNATLGNANTDIITSTGKLVTSNGLTLTNLTTSTANYLAGLGVVDTGGIAYITDGDSGSACLGVYDGSNWKRISLGANISST